MAQEWLGMFPIGIQSLPPRLMEKFRILFYIILCFASLCLAYVEATLFKRPLKKRCRILPAGGLGVSPSFKKSPKIGGYRGLIKTISAFSININTFLLSIQKW